jgi:hypothetical protein
VHVPSPEFGLSTPSFASECASSPRTKGGRAYSPAGEGLGESQFRRLWRKSSALRVGNLIPAMGARNQVGMGLSYRPASLCSLATNSKLGSWNGFLEWNGMDLSFRLCLLLCGSGNTPCPPYTLYLSPLITS